MGGYRNSSATFELLVEITGFRPCDGYWQGPELHNPKVTLWFAGRRVELLKSGLTGIQLSPRTCAWP